MRGRLLGGVVGLLLALTACGGAPADSSGPQRSAPGRTSSPGADSTPQSVPPGCAGGQARDLDNALRIIKDGPECPGSTNQFWQKQLGDKWTTPTIISYDDGTLPDSKCADGGNPDDFSDNAFYCPLDDKVAYSNQLMERLFQKGGPYLPVVVLQHELGHRADHIADIVGVVSRSEENQADCDAGANTKFSLNAGRLPFTDALKSAQLLFELGDVSNFGAETANDPGAHGSPPQRLTAYGRGYFQGLGICDNLGRNPTGHTL
ncbi:MAG TPA: neutral zinc metallopeptidase [Frankiaceae bacterium]|nr:neutral zinc metallopeptidase [Frankiaceae bacterium]